jgi:hypothetical protein
MLIVIKLLDFEWRNIFLLFFRGRKAGWEIQALEAPLVSQASREK